MLRLLLLPDDVVLGILAPLMTFLMLSSRFSVVIVDLSNLASRDSNSRTLVSTQDLLDIILMSNGLRVLGPRRITVRPLCEEHRPIGEGMTYSFAGLSMGCNCIRVRVRIRISALGVRVWGLDVMV